MNCKNKFSKSYLFAFIWLILVCGQSCVSTRNNNIKQWEKYEWKVVKTEKSSVPSWVIYTRKIAETNFLEYKIEGNVSSTPQASIKAFKEDIYSQSKNLKNKKFPLYEIIHESNDSLLTYVIHNEPFPLKNTEMSVMYSFFSGPDGKEGVSWMEDWDFNPVPPSKKLSRVQSFRGSLIFTSISDNTTNAIKSVHFDPKNMPLWLVEPMVFNFLKNGLKDIREMTIE